MVKRLRVGRMGPAILTILGVAIAACVYDPDNRCGPAMTYVETAKACVCNSNAIPVPGGCKQCPSDEVSVDGKCGCAAGQTKSAANLCVPVAGLGDPCDDTGAAPCTSTEYSYCAVRSGSTTGTCTKTCSADTDCDTSFTCADWEDQPYCRTFEGFGESCASSADCTGDAKFCETIQTHVCVVTACSLTDHDCPRGLMCCDFTGRYPGLGTMCATRCP